jgi:hypothetical protein
VCNLQHIPERLRRQGRPTIEQFQIGEELYFRCKEEALENPYKVVSLCEVSHNRQGHVNNILSEADDVLYAITGEAERYTDKKICTLKIVALTNEGAYHKTFHETKNGTEFVGRMKLMHDPDECMYPHSIFRVWLNDEVVDMQNYDVTLKKVNKIRTYLKEDIAAMIVARKVDQNEATL